MKKSVSAIHSFIAENAHCKTASRLTSLLEMLSSDGELREIMIGLDSGNRQLVADVFAGLAKLDPMKWPAKF